MDRISRIMIQKFKPCLQHISSKTKGGRKTFWAQKITLKILMMLVEIHTI